MPLSSSQRREIETRLQEERRRAEADLARSIGERSASSEQERAGDLSVVPLHPADLGTDAMQSELEASNATRVSRQLAEIDAALERLYAHPEQFGVCEDTGGEIPFARLRLIPWARTCGEAGA